MTLTAAADGSALGNPGPAGWAWYIDETRWDCGGWPHGTNNMGELTAVLELLRQTARVDDDLLILCDSQYVINSLTKWLPGWKRKGWRKGDGKPVLNVEIMKALDEALAGRRVRFEWVKGHSGHELNEEADRLANAAAVAYREGRTPQRGPGLGGSPGDAAPVVEPPALPSGGASGGDQPDLFADELLAASEPTARTSDEQQVIDAERSLLTDEVRGDRAAVAALLHPDWQEVGASGRLWSRTAMLSDIGPLERPVDLEVLSVQRVREDAILLLWRGADGRGSSLRSSLWVQQQGQWRQLFHQGTPER